MEAATAANDGDVQMIDSSSVRVHQHAERRALNLLIGPGRPLNPGMYR